MKQYLDFLELAQNATPEEIMNSVEEKEKIFSQLLQNAPNDYLKKIHAKNLATLSEIRAAIGKGYAKDIKAADAPVKTANEKPFAWLIKHTEHKAAKPYPLFKGENFIGRMSRSKTNEIIIEDDAYVSRQHATVTVEESKITLNDAGSKNGIFLNANPVKIKKQTLLSNNDTIQVGNTKLVLKIEDTTNVHDIVKEVEQTDYMKTIVIDIL